MLKGNYLFIPVHSESSLGSSEQLPDSDFEPDDSEQRAAPPHCLMKQESEVSVDDDQLSYRDSLDLSSQSATNTDPEQEVDKDQENPAGIEPPALPESGPPDEDTGAEQTLSASLAELNVNQSNNNYSYSPILSMSGLRLTRLCGKKLPLTRNRDSSPEFVWYHSVKSDKVQWQESVFYALNSRETSNWGFFYSEHQNFILTCADVFCSCTDLSSARLLLL